MSVISNLASASKRTRRAASVYRSCVEALDRRQLFAYAVPAGYVEVGSATVGSTNGNSVDVKLNGQSATLKSGAQYIAVASGTIGIAADGRKGTVAQYQRQGDRAWVSNAKFGVQMSGVGWSGGDPANGDYVYGATFTGNGTVAKAKLVDSPYGDNSGSFSIRLYEQLPTVSISAGGTLIEDGSGEGAWVRASRSGGDVSQQLVVKIRGTTSGASTGQAMAEPGTDYTVASTITIPAGASDSEPVWLTAKDDPDAEGVETIGLEIQEDVGKYILAQATSRAAAQVDDDVNVRSIEVSRGNFLNTSYGYSFNVKIKLVGEHLDLVQIKQKINSSTSLTDYTGTNLTRAQILDKYPGSDPVVVDSNGQWETDTGWDWDDVTVTEGKKNGEATQNDSQLLQVPGGDIAPLNATTHTQINWLAATTKYFQIETRKKGTTAVLKDFDWGYKWNNYNCYWAPADGAPKQSCVGSHKGFGSFSDIQGITGLD